MNTITCGDRTAVLLYSCKDHVHNTWEIIYQAQGTAIESIAGQDSQVAEGCVTVIPAGLYHYKTSHEGFLDLWIQANDLPFPDVPFSVSDADGSILRLTELLIRTLISREADYEIIADGILDVICMLIRKNMQDTVRYPFVDALKTVIYNNISNPDFDLHTAIAQSGFHPDYFRRCFKEKTGQTPLAYLTKLRVNKAKMLLAESSFAGVADAALKCGFHDSFYFSTCFKKAVGCSPLQYRKSLSGAEGSSEMQNKS